MVADLWKRKGKIKGCSRNSKSIDNFAKDSGKEFFIQMHCVFVTILSDSVGIRSKNEVHLGKTFLASIFSAIVYYSPAMSKSSKFPNKWFWRHFYSSFNHFNPI